MAIVATVLFLLKVKQVQRNNQCNIRLTVYFSTVATGISDYKDGTTTKKWQNYASLTAASVMKSIICGMDAPTNV